MANSRRIFYGFLALSLGNGSLASSGAPASSAKMPSLKLRNGVEMPIMSAGVWLYSVEEAEKAVEAAFNAGFSHIDTAYDYKNQQGVATAIQKAMAKGMARDDIFITTKIPGCGIQNVSAAHVGDCSSTTFSRLSDDFAQLNTSHIDLMLIHFPPCAGDDGSAQSPTKSSCFPTRSGCSSPGTCDMIKAQWNVLTEAYNKGKLRAIGVSNYCSACLTCLDDEEVQPMVNQVHFQVGMGPDPQGFKTRAEKDGIVLQAWSPLGMGGSGSSPILSGNLTTSIGKKHGKSPVQIALKWIVSQNVSVATKSSNPAHLASNLDIFDFELDAEDKQALDDADFAASDDPSFLCRDPKASLQLHV